MHCIPSVVYWEVYPLVLGNSTFSLPKIISSLTNYPFLTQNLTQKQNSLYSFKCVPPTVLKEWFKYVNSGSFELKEVFFEQIPY